MRTLFHFASDTCVAMQAAGILEPAETQREQLRAADAPRHVGKTHLDQPGCGTAWAAKQLRLPV
jgi:hypothetical protein